MSVLEYILIFLGIVGTLLFLFDMVSSLVKKGAAIRNFDLRLDAFPDKDRMTLLVNNMNLSDDFDLGLLNEATKLAEEVLSSMDDKEAEKVREAIYQASIVGRWSFLYNHVYEAVRRASW